MYSSYLNGNNYYIWRWALKKRGFITLECIISMFVLSIIVYMITFSINNSFNLLNKNKEYSTMLNLAQNYMNETKNDIKYKNDKINTETIYLNKFQINKIITKKENYYNWNCYSTYYCRNSYICYS